MKKTLSLFVTMAMLFTGCFNEDNSVAPSQQNATVSADDIKAGIIGTWVQEMLDGEPCPTNIKQVLVFTSATTGTVSLSAGDSLWLNHLEMIDLTIGDGVMQWKTQETPTTQAVITCQVDKLTDNVLAISDVRHVIQDGKVLSEVKCVKEFRRDMSDYQQALYGIWEGHITSEKSEYDDGELHRWEYLPNGTFRYYNNVDGQWVLNNDAYAEYFVDDILLCMRWKNNGDDKKEQREWWEIESIENGVMKWTALRKNADGSTYTASFEMTKVAVPSMNEVAQNMLGKWIVAERNNAAVPTNDKAVITFNSLSAGELSLSISDDAWYHAQAVDVTLNDNLLVILNQKDENNSVTMNLYVTNINQNELEASFWRVEVKDGQTVNGKHHDGSAPAGGEGAPTTDGEGAPTTDGEGVPSASRKHVTAHSYVDRYERVTVDYSQAILGVWEGISTGSQGSQYDDGEMHRWEYLQDGTFRYYNKVDGQWVLNNDAYAEYFVDGTLLCTRWKNNGDDKKEQREWWEIESIENGVMKWTALRKNADGSTYTASFEMKKVPVPSMTEVAQNMLGKWIVAERNNAAVPTNEKAVITFNSLSAGQLSLSLSNKTWYHAQDVKVSLKDNLIVILNQKDEKNSVTMNFYVTNINQNEMETSFWRVEVKDGQTADGNTNHREGTTPADSLGVHSTDGHGAHSTDSLGVHQTGRSKGSAKTYVDRYVRIAVDYSQAILGVWEGSSTGSQGSQYDDGGMHRWEYLQDGTFRYYNKVDGQWVLNNDAYAEYFVDGILLCTRWKNNGDDQKEQREWWEIESIENGVMKWKALRRNADGSTYTASFEMTKVK